MLFSELHPDSIDYPFDLSNHIVRLEEIREFESFPFLTPESIQILHQIINSHSDKIQSNDRISFYLRGLGYHSSFLRDLCYSPPILQYLRHITGIELIPHYLFSNVGHVNIGLPNQKDVDHWHYDSVPYVLILLVTDPMTFEGGILEYEKESRVFQVRFPHAGYAFFMKGSEIRHHVTTLHSGRRWTLINSYMDKKETRDTTNLKTFEKDPAFQKEMQHKPIFYQKIDSL